MQKKSLSFTFIVVLLLTLTGAAVPFNATATIDRHIAN